MGWRLVGTKILTGELSGTTHYQPFTPTKNTILRAVRTSLIGYNNPSFTSINMKLYSDNGGVPGILIATSTNSQTPAALKPGALSHYVTETWFEFDDISLKADSMYHLVLNGVSYVGTESSHLAWMRGWPDPVYREGISVTFEVGRIAPHQFYLIGADL